MRAGVERMQEGVKEIVEEEARKMRIEEGGSRRRDAKTLGVRETRAGGGWWLIREVGSCVRVGEEGGWWSWGTGLFGMKVVRASAALKYRRHASAMNKRKTSWAAA
eukprot:1541650-Rhodomonas_salina.6